MQQITRILLFIFSYSIYSFSQYVGTDGGSGTFSAGENAEQIGQWGFTNTPGLVVLDDIIQDGLNVIGGDGGSLSGTQGKTLDASAGYGAFVGGLGISGITNNVLFQGGDGGNISNASALFLNGGMNVAGREALLIVNVNNLINISSGSYNGGNGGVAITDSVDPSVQSENLLAKGGHGFVFLNTVTLPSSSLVIDGGNFYGGNGGNVTSGIGGNVDAGSGMYVRAADSVIINNGTFTGGSAGTADGIIGELGAGLLVEDSQITINNGTFNSRGLVAYTVSGSNDIAINGGNFNGAEFTGNNDLTIDGGSFQNIVFSDNESSRLIRFFPEAFSGSLSIDGGTLDVDAWRNSDVQQISLAEASLTFNTGSFTLSNGGEVELTHENAALNFNGGTSTFEGGSTLDIGLGAVTGTDIVMASGSATKIGLTANGNNFEPTVGTLSATTGIDFQAGAIVQLINDGSYNRFDELALEANPLIQIATADSITSALTLDDVYIVGDRPWLTGVTGITNNTSGANDILYAEIGLLPLKKALNAEGQLANLAEKLQPLIDESNEIAQLLNTGFPSQQAAISGITDSFFRAPEVANSLIGLQSVVRDQVAGRTRGYLKANRFGASAPSGPRGPDAGWWDRSMERINESLPKADLRGGLDALNASLPKVELSFDRQEDQQQSYYKRFMNWLNEKAPSFKPSAPTLTSDYKSWGKAYYSDLAQDAVDGFAGYEAQVIGGITGMDRKLDHGVLGWAAGYADTTILGNFEQNADVDTLHGTIYYTAATQRAYLDASMSYAYSLVETIGPAGAGGYTADYTASNLSFALGAGVGFTAFNDRVQVTPEFLFLSTLYDQEAYTETSAVTGMPDKQFSAYDDWSHKVELGATFSLLQILESTSMNIAIQPELRLHWLHEFNPNLADQSYLFNESQFSAALQAREENLLRTGLGIRFWDWADHRTEFSFDLDAITGSDYEEFTVSGSFIHRF